MRGSIATILGILILLPPAAAQTKRSLPPREVQLLKIDPAANPSDLWSPLELPKAKEPPARIAYTKMSPDAPSPMLKITFAGGNWPTLTSTPILEDWSPYQTFRADVYASKPGVVGFQVLQEKSTRERGWDGSVSRWVKTAFVHPGKNEIAASLRLNDYSAIHPKLGKAVRFEVFMYRPDPGETVFVDNVRLTDQKLPTTKVETRFRVLGTPWTVSGVQELGKMLARDWKPPVEATVEEVEAKFRKTLAALRRDHPRARLAILRDGENGFAGWKDAYWSSHGPDGMLVDRAENFGKHSAQEIFMRHRSPLMRVDVSSIPAESRILAAQLVIVRANDFYDKERDPRKNPNMWVAEACNRPWAEYEVNAYEYARGKFWKNIGGMHWDGADPDFLPVYLAHGPGGGKVSVFDFTEAVKFWVNSRQSNHGFMLHGDAKDWLSRAHYRESAEVKHRPALMVIYEPP